MKDIKFYLLALVLLISSSVFAQNTTVTGTVTDEKGEPMIGVSIRLKSNPSVGAATNLDGKFMIVTPKPNEVLTVTFIGYEGQEITAKVSAPLSITLREEQTTLNEVVVVGAVVGIARLRRLLGLLALLDVAMEFTILRDRVSPELLPTVLANLELDSFLFFVLGKLHRGLLAGSGFTTSWYTPSMHSNVFL